MTLAYAHDHWDLDFEMHPFKPEVARGSINRGQGLAVQWNVCSSDRVGYLDLLLKEGPLGRLEDENKARGNSGQRLSLSRQSKRVVHNWWRSGCQPARPVPCRGAIDWWMRQVKGQLTEKKQL
jgi:hypothetical protein